MALGDDTERDAVAANSPAALGGDTERDAAAANSPAALGGGTKRDVAASSALPLGGDAERHVAAANGVAALGGDARRDVPGDGDATPARGDALAGKSGGSRSSRRHICNEVRRQVVERDGLSCTFVGRDGRRCGARAFLQLDHEYAWARGGADTSENLRIRCAQHNRLVAEQEFGGAAMRDAVERRENERAQSGEQTKDPEHPLVSRVSESRAA